MEQRRLRLGDILDDYCPRERRVTNHVIVAMVDDDIKQTRCTTCDAEHPYKGGKAPRRRKPESVVVPAAPAPPMSRPAENPMHAAPEPPPVHDDSDIRDEPAPAETPASEPAHAAAPPAATQDPGVDEGPVHRPLIRATLPRPEGIKTERPVPEFTIRQNGGRGNGNFRGFSAKGRGGHAMNGGGRSGGGPRFGRGPQGRGQGRGGASSGFGRGGPKKRSR